MTKPHRISDEDALDFQSIKDPYPKIAQRRAACPVSYQALGDLYMLYDYGDIRPLLQDPRASRDPRKGNPGSYMRELNGGMPGLESHMLFVDPPQHTRLRGLVSKAFTPRAVERLRPTIQMWTDRLLDAAAEQGRFDLMEAFAMPLPTIVIAELLGVDPADHPRFKTWSMRAIHLLNILAPPEVKQAALQAREEFVAYLAEQIARRRHTPGDDLMSGLIQVCDGDDRLSDAEISMTCRVLLTAGNLTTTDLIGNGVAALLDHPEQLAQLRSDPGLIDRVVEEVLRWDPPVMATARIPLSDQTIAGCPIPKGASVFMSLAGANRDRRERDEPDRFDIQRPDTHHVSFGGGAHFCLGAHLARLEGRIALGTLVQRFPKLRLAEGGRCERDTIPGFRGHSVLELDVS